MKDFEPPEPGSRKYSKLINAIEDGIVKIPKFQREFVWSIDKTAELLDSILKGYPIGTFILWQTDVRLNNIKNVGNISLPDTPKGTKVQYVLDGQQRITSLFAAYRGATIQKTGEKKVTDYKDIYVNLNKSLEENDDQIVTAEPTGNKHVSLFHVLNFNRKKEKELKKQFNFTDDEFDTIDKYKDAFKAYEFSIIVLMKEDINSAIEVFTRINTGGQTLTLFDIMCAMTYDETQKFDMRKKWEHFVKELEDIRYGEISSTVVLNLLSIVLSDTQECRQKTILNLDKQKIIDNWDNAILALKNSIDYFRTTYRIPVSRLLPYDSLLVPFSYFFFFNKEKPQPEQRQYLEEFFWRVSLSRRYSSGQATRLAQDIKRIYQILKNQRPDYRDTPVHLDSSESLKPLIEANFNTNDSYCKAVLCLLAYHEPKDFQDNGKVTLNNSWLKIATSKNYHHFFPKNYLKKNGVDNSNSLINIAFVSENLNKRKIGARAPSDYIEEFKNGNPEINKALNSHLIDLKGFGIESDDYKTFLSARAQWIFNELKARIDLIHREPVNEEIQELVAGGESETVEFKSTLRYDLRTKEKNKKLEYVIVKTIAAFLNSKGGNLFIGIDDNQNALGLLDDLETLDKKDSDGFEMRLVNILTKYIGREHSTHITITFPFYDDVKVCRVQVEKSSRPVFTKFGDKEDFFVRLGCSSQPLDREEQSKYEKEHWGDR